MKLAMIISGSVLMAMLIAMIIMYEVRDKKDEKLVTYENFVIKSSKKVFNAITLISVVLGTLLISLNVFLNVSLVVNILLLLFFILATFCEWTYRERIEVLADKVIYTPLFSKKEIYDFKDITKVERVELQYGLISYQVYVGKMVFTVENLLQNADLFVRWLDMHEIKIEEKKR